MHQGVGIPRSDSTLSEEEGGGMGERVLVSGDTG